MSKCVVELELPIPIERSESLSGAVLAEEGWTVARNEAGLFQAHEDQARLHCHCPPATAEVALVSTGAGTTALTVTGTVPGFGPISAKHAREQADFLARRIGLAAAAGARSWPAPAVRRLDLFQRIEMSNREQRT